MEEKKILHYLGIKPEKLKNIKSANLYSVEAAARKATAIQSIYDFKCVRKGSKERISHKERQRGS
jgi:hypothetical protein